jgi:general secretion pathway protein L
MVRDFLTWWVGQLADCVPERWCRLGSVDANALVIAPTGSLAGGIDAVAVSLRRNGRETSLGRFGLTADGLAGLPRSAEQSVVLRLIDADVLRKTVILPMAAERDLDQVLSFEMDRETPFSAEEVFWSHQIIRRDRQRGQLSVRLLLVPRAGLSVLLGDLERAGIQPKRAEIATGPDERAYLPLLSDGGRRHGAGGGSWLRWPAAATCVGLMIALIAMPLVKQAATLADLDQKIAMGREAASEATKLRQDIERLSGTVDLIESEQDKVGRPLATLAALTLVVPDDTYLTELQYQRRKVTLSGRSATASRLIGALAASNQLQNPVFAAPVTRIEAIRSEVFTITAEVGP